MTIQLNPYINFNKNARQAFTFYQSVLGGTLELHTFGEFGADPDPSNQDNIMHATLTLETGEAIMGADTPSMMEYRAPCGFSISLTGSDADVLRDRFAKLADGGTIVMPLEKQIWGDEFGMVLDQFGINWMVDIHQEA